jgi:3-oxoacyl-(acyl-carrier-protein) synthase
MTAEGRAVITGIGPVAPNGIGAETFWANTRKGVSGIRKIDRFDPAKYTTRVAGTVEGFDATEYIDKRLMVQTDNWTWMALAGAKLAMEDASFDPAAGVADRMSVVTASSSGGNEFGQREIQSLWAKGPRFVGAYQSIAWFYAATTGQLAIKHGMKGHCNVIVSEQAGGLDALAMARRQIRRGEMDAVLSGGTEAPIGPYAVACQQHLGLLAETDDPDDYRPFGADACGYIPGEGGAVLLVESLEAARARGARVYAEVIGHGATNDALNVAAPAADGRQYGRAIKLALDDAGITAADVDAVFADGFGTIEADAAEATALKSVFGGRSVPVTAPKSMVGRLYAGGSSLDAATAALAIGDGYIPPTINVGSTAPGADLDVVTEGRAQPLDTVLVAARGAGGFNSALVLRRVTE